MGRPTLLTPELQGEICKAVSEGATRHAAAAAVGIDRSTLQDWLAKGKRGQEGYTDFSDAIKKADAQAENLRVKRIGRAGEGGVWQADAWWLERRNPDDWGSNRHEIAQLKRDVAELRKAIEGRGK